MFGVFFPLSSPNLSVHNIIEALLSAIEHHMTLTENIVATMVLYTMPYAVQKKKKKQQPCL